MSSTRPRSCLWCGLCGLSLFLGMHRGVQADRFVFVDESGESSELTGRLAGSGQGVTAIELPDGRWHLIRANSLREHIKESGPEPFGPDEVVDVLRKEFGKDRIQSHYHRPYLAVFIRDRRSPPDVDDQTAFLKQATRFMQSVQAVFLRFMRHVRVKPKPITYPLVVAIFETDEDFDDYARKVTGNRGISAGRIAGFYDALTNRLVLRLRECHSFEVPLHEGIHQLVHNRGVLNRMAPVPIWFHEGLATGFEGDGKRVRRMPTQVISRYSRMALKARLVDWPDMALSDRAFQGDVFAGEAYGHAWGMHWLLVTQHRARYTVYLKLLGQKQPLQVDTEEQRLHDLESAIGLSVEELQGEFRPAIETALRRRQR